MVRRVAPVVVAIAALALFLLMSLYSSLRPPETTPYDWGKPHTVTPVADAPAVGRPTTPIVDVPLDSTEQNKRSERSTANTTAQRREFFTLYFRNATLVVRGDAVYIFRGWAVAKPERIVVNFSDFYAVLTPSGLCVSNFCQPADLSPLFAFQCREVCNSYVCASYCGGELYARADRLELYLNNRTAVEIGGEEVALEWRPTNGTVVKVEGYGEFMYLEVDRETACRLAKELNAEVAYSYRVDFVPPFGDVLPDEAWGRFVTYYVVFVVGDLCIERSVTTRP